jgi:hypothetical protein
MKMDTKSCYNCGADGIPLTAKFCSNTTCKAPQFERSHGTTASSSRIAVKIERSRTPDDGSDLDDTVIESSAQLWSQARLARVGETSSAAVPSPGTLQSIKKEADFARDKSNKSEAKKKLLGRKQSHFGHHPDNHRQWRQAYVIATLIPGQAAVKILNSEGEEDLPEDHVVSAGKSEPF